MVAEDRGKGHISGRQGWQYYRKLVKRQLHRRVEQRVVVVMDSTGQTC